MGWKHYQTVDHRKWEPQVVRGLFGIRFNLSFEEKISLSQNVQKSPKNLHKTAKRWLMK